MVLYQGRSHSMTMERHVVTFFCADGNNWRTGIIAQVYPADSYSRPHPTPVHRLALDLHQPK